MNKYRVKYIGDGIWAAQWRHYFPYGLTEDWKHNLESMFISKKAAKACVKELIAEDLELLKSTIKSTEDSWTVSPCLCGCCVVRG